MRIASDLLTLGIHRDDWWNDNSRYFLSPLLLLQYYHYCYCCLNIIIIIIVVIVSHRYCCYITIIVFVIIVSHRYCCYIRWHRDMTFHPLPTCIQPQDTCIWTTLQCSDTPGHNLPVTRCKVLGLLSRVQKTPRLLVLFLESWWEYVFSKIFAVPNSFAQCWINFLGYSRGVGFFSRVKVIIRLLRVLNTPWFFTLFFPGCWWEGVTERGSYVQGSKGLFMPKNMYISHW